MPIELVNITSANMAVVAAQAKRKQLGVALDLVTNTELDLFNRFMNKMMAVHGNNRRWIDFHLNHMGDYLLGFGVAKKQFGGIKFGGATPAGGEFGIDQWRAGYTGVGQDWNAEGTTTALTAKNWIHGAGGMLAGTIGNDIRYLDGFVGVIAGLGDYRRLTRGKHSEIECFQIRLDNRLLKPIYVGQQLRLSDYPILELDEAILVKDRTSIRIQYITNLASINEPFLAGVVFGHESSLNKITATNLDGATNKLYEQT